MTEKKLESEIVKYVKSKGGLCLKWTSPGYTGVPDRIALLPGGGVIFIEVKRPGLKDGRTSRQKRVANILTGLGFTVIRASDMEAVYEYI